MDEALLRGINALGAIPFFATLALILSSRWMIPVICGPLALSLARRRRWAAMITIALSMGLADVVSSRAVKPLVARERPCRALTGLAAPVSCGPGRSFPSSHAAISFAFLLSAAPTVRLGFAIFTPLVVAISGSRVLLGVHYPSDVAGGAAIGSILGALAWLGRKKLELRTTSRLPSTSP